jgi:Tfp pilus assembly protein PilN
MIQFNLLPDVKVEYLKTRRSQRLIYLGATVLAGLALAIFVGLFLIVNVAQKKHLNDLNADIKKDTAELQSIPNIDKILTVQNQLTSLTALHEQDPATARLFDYLGQVTPAQVTISSVKADFAANTINITGNANALSTVNQFVDTLKFTTFTTNQNSTPQKAFSDVVLTSFTKSDKDATYQISFKFDPTIFNNTLEVKLSVPKIISTRSETEKPADLFKQNTNQLGQ